MNQKEIKIGDRLYHAMFGWCRVTHPPTAEKVLVDLEADEIEYYVMGMGYVKYTRPGNNETHILYTPISDLIRNPDEMTPILSLAKLAMNPTITFWDKK